MMTSTPLNHFDERYRHHAIYKVKYSLTSLLQTRERNDSYMVALIYFHIRVAVQEKTCSII